MLSALSQSVDGSMLPHTMGTPVPTLARQGRHNQRYGENGERLVAGCIPVRVLGGRPEDVQVLLVSSRNTVSGGWVFPKGGWELDETAESAARRETVEESGVRGKLVEPMVGCYRFQQRKASPGSKGCMAYMYVLHVEEELKQYPEQEERMRKWFTLEEASRECRHAWMREALHQWMRTQGWGALADELAAQAIVSDDSSRRSVSEH